MAPVAAVTGTGGADAAPAGGWLGFRDGRLVYGQDQQGNRIPDFSDVGYRGGVAPPVADVKITVKPTGGDDTGAIQQAIDRVSALPLGSDGLRGAVLLSPGSFRIGGRLTIKASGVVLRGSGSGAGGSVLTASGNPRTLLTIGGTDGTYQQAGRPTPVTDDYVPVGADTLHVADASGLRVGDRIIVQRPVTAGWLHAIGMDAIPGRADGKPIRQWEPHEGLTFERVVTAVDGNRITLDVPITNALEKQYTQATVWKYTLPGRISEVGVERLAADASAFAASPGYAGVFGQSKFAVVDQLENGWLRDITTRRFGNGLVDLNSYAKNVSVLDTRSLAMAVPETHAGPAAYSIKGQRNLVYGCAAEAFHTHIWVTQGNTAGPNVFSHCTASGPYLDAGPHQRWASGVLFDDLELDSQPGGSFNLINRGSAGSGHGWAQGNTVLYRCRSASYLVEQDTSFHNWAIGCTGQQVPSKKERNGEVQAASSGMPESLYDQQLAERLGASAAAKPAPSDTPAVNTPRTAPASPSGTGASASPAPAQVPHSSSPTPGSVPAETPSGSPDSLAFTGPELAVELGLTGAVLMGGGLAMAYSRRRTRRTR
ncbi:hypothetical protein [Kitasatospora sp. NE20-6]|uniref:hypothetical protein n=1 Tax=Kitasatospora sp. NE20-6 TaxID=2859066 RepID=UPI0038B3485C